MADDSLQPPTALGNDQTFGDWMSSVDMLGSGGNTIPANPPSPGDAAAISSALARVPANPNLVPTGIPGGGGGSYAPIPSTGILSNPNTPTSPSPITALGPQGVDPNDHLSLARALALAMNPSALAIMSQLQRLKFERNSENLKNMEFAEMLKQHAQAAQDHADAVRQAHTEFKLRMIGLGAKEVGPGYAPSADEAGRYIETTAGNYVVPSAEQQADAARRAKEKDTTDIPNPFDPTGPKISVPTDTIYRDYKDMLEAKKLAATNGETAERKDYTYDKDGTINTLTGPFQVKAGHTYTAISGKDTGTIYKMIDMGITGKTDAQQEARMRAREHDEDRQQAKIEKRQGEVGKQLTNFTTLREIAMGLNTEKERADREFADAERAWNEAKNALYQPQPVGMGAESYKLYKKELERAETESRVNMDKAKKVTDELTDKSKNAWQKAYGAHEGLKRYGELEVGGTTRDATGNLQGYPSADWKQGMGPGEVTARMINEEPEQTTGGGTFTGTSTRQSTPIDVKTVSTNVSNFYQQKFGKQLPISAMGQSGTHDKLGLDHRNAFDIAINPDSEEGKAIIDYLKQNNIPYLAAHKASPGVSTGPHIHVGQTSSRIGTGGGGATTTGATAGGTTIGGGEIKLSDLIALGKKKGMTDVHQIRTIFMQEHPGINIIEDR